MAKEFLSEAFKKLNILGEDIFNVDDDGIKDLREFEKAGEEEENTSISVIDPEAETVEDLQVSYIGKVILECPVCHSFIFKDREKIEINKVTELANSDEECPYCCTVGGFNIIGQVVGFDPDAEEETENTTDTTDVVEVEETTDDTATEEDTTEEEEVVEEGLEHHSDVEGKGCDECGTEEGILGTIARGITPIPVIGKILGDGLEAASEEEEKETVCEVCGKNPCECAQKELTEEQKDTDEGCEEECTCDKEEDEDEEEEKDESLLGTALGAAAVGGLAAGVGSGLTNKILSSSLDREACKDDDSCTEAMVTETPETKTTVVDLINDALTKDGWTECEYDDEDDSVPVRVFSGESLVGEFLIKDGALVKLADTEVIDEDLTVTTDKAEGTVEVTSTEENKTVTIADNAVADVATEEKTDEVEEEEMTDEVITPLTDEEKNEIEKGTTDTEEVVTDVTEEEVPAETEADVDEIEEESFDRLSEKFLKNTYDNVESYRTTRAQSVDNTLRLEGVITFKSGKEKTTSYILEAKDITPSGKARFVGKNQQISTAKKAFTVSGKLTEGKFIAESLNYNYNTKDVDGKSTKVYGTVSNRKNK